MFLPAVALLALAVASDEAADDWGEDGAEPAVLDGTVSAERDRRPDDEVRRTLDDPALQGASPEDALESLPGVLLLRDGGPLAPARLRIRGLGGSRASVDLMGLRLDDPATGDVDASLLPLFAAARASMLARPTTEGLAGELSLDLASTVTPSARVRVGAGTLETLRLDGWAAAPTPSFGQVSAGLSLASTRGDFAYTPLPSVAGEDTRRNNDQRIAALVLHAREPLPVGDVEFVAWGADREGGVPGFATAPTDGLRAQRTLGAVRLALERSGRRRNAQIDVDVRGARRSTRANRSVPSTTSSYAASVGTLLDLKGPFGVDASVNGRLGNEALATDLQRFDDSWARRRARIGGALHKRAFDDQLDVDADASFEALAEPNAEGRTDLDALPQGSVSATWHAPFDVSLGSRLAHSARAPTLDELFAPDGLVLGNLDLLPERATQADVFVTARLDRFATGRVSVFGARLEETILYVNRNAFEVEPVNTGPLWRSGADLTASLTPLDIVRLEVTGYVMVSYVEATRAALPVAPPLAGRASLRFGPRDGAQLVTIARARAGAPTTLFGTLATDGYALFDVVGRMPLGDNATFTTTLSNALDTRDARDANLLPLPGRQVFVSLEVST